MEIYLAGTPVTLTVPLQDRSGNPINVTSINYRVVNQDGVEVVAQTALSAFAAGSPSAVIEIPSSVNTIVVVPSPITSNQIDQFTPREVRTVELFLNVAGNTVMIAKSFALEPADPLIVGINSFQTFSESELVALDIPNIDGWNAATEHDKMAALVDARARICQLNFWLLNSNINWGQDNLNFVPEGAYQSPYAAANNQLFMFNGNLSLLTPTQYNNLPIRFRAALRKAQVAEADAILGGDPVEARRREGLMLESIGEVKQMYRAGKPIDLPVSKRALQYLSQFVTFSKRVGRG
jgi:hypothetical protein